MVVPPSDLRDQEAKPVKTEEKVEPPTLKIPFIKQPIPQPSTEVVVVGSYNGNYSCGSYNAYTAYN